VNGSQLPIIALLAFIALFTTLSHVGGTRRIAKAFPAAHRPLGKRYYFAWGTINHVTWRFSLDLVVAQDGLYLATILPFRPLNPPAFLPWGRVQVAQDNPYFVDRAELLIPELGTRVSFQGSEARAVLQAAHAYQS
jgi:hypothetical protein